MCPCVCAACLRMPFPCRESHPGSGSALIQSLVSNKMSPAKDTNLTEAPRVLALHLKRFVWAPQCVGVSSQVFFWEQTSWFPKAC